jgi:hypothetical protein
VTALFLRSALSLQVSLFYVGLDPAEKVRKRKARGPTQSRLLDGGGAGWTPEYLNLSLDSEAAKLLEYIRTRPRARGRARAPIT